MPVRRFVIPAVGIAFGLWSMATVASVYSMGASAPSIDGGLSKRLTTARSIALISPSKDVKWVSASLVPAIDANQQDRFWLLHDDCGTRCVPSGGIAATLPQPGIARHKTASHEIDARFKSVVAQAELTTDKLAALFGKSESRDVKEVAEVRVASLDTEQPVASALQVLEDEPAVHAPTEARFEQTLVDAVKADEERGPVAERFAPLLAERQRSYSVALAYFDSMATEDDAEEVVVAALDDGDGDSETLAIGIPDSAPLPDRRPKWQPPQQPGRVARQSDDDDDKGGKEVLAFAKPDNPSGGIGKAFKDLFSAPNNPSDGTAIYDIAAATVYMPDGTKLEAHSGLGHMVDNPNYIDKKNRGPTPPNTYKLVMRESRFHGVEAIRMLPVGDKKMYGRDGILAHTYMLRGGLAQSNGCVVFKHYDRFLHAFKKGHITRLVVVPGRSRSKPVQTARNGSDA